MSLSEATGVERARAIRRVLLVELVCNLVVAITKVIVGVLTGSLAVLSDAAHSFVDGTANILGIILVSAGAAPPDVRHPYGHRKIEVLAATAVGILIAAAAVAMGKEAVLALLHGERPVPVLTTEAFAVLIAALGVNIGVVIYESRRAKQLRSPLLLADAAHTAADVAVTISVLVAVVAAKYGVSWADPVGALVVLVIIGRVAWGILSANLSILIDSRALDPDHIANIVAQHPGAIGCHRVRSRGPADAAHVDLHLVLDSELPLREAHIISHEISALLRKEIPGLIDVAVHMEPEGDSEEPLDSAH